MKAAQPLHLALVLLVTVSTACATTSTTSTTWTDPAVAGYGRAGWVESVQEVIQRTEGNPGAGAVAGALIGGFLFGGRGPAAVAGAIGGAAVGAAASQGGSEQRTYHIVVRFDDGGYGTFAYAAYAPFRPGERVVVTPDGLARAG